MHMPESNIQQLAIARIKIHITLRALHVYKNDNH